VQQQRQRQHHLYHIFTTFFCIFRVSICMWNEEAICVWCDGINAQCPPALTPQPQLQEHASRPRKRKQELSEMSSNVQTPRKTARTGKGAAGTVFGSFEDEDEDVTPRPPHLLSNLVRLLSPNSATNTAAVGITEPNDDVSIPSASSSRSSTHTIDSRGIKRRRPTSPAKQLEERRYAKYPIQHRPVANLDLVNEMMRDVVKRVRRIGRAKGVLSPKDAEWAQILSAGDADVAKDIIDTSENCYGAAPDLARMQRIVERAARNAAAGASEAAWNSGVHDFLIEEAYFGSSVRSYLVWENM
jgi:hypothetical protein